MPIIERRRFEPGDVVQLRGGGPHMTVSEVYDYDSKIRLRVLWLNFVTGEICDRTLPEAAVNNLTEQFYRP